jgi:uncharacterized repeat protein (TIGR01451 family)
MWLASLRRFVRRNFHSLPVKYPRSRPRRTVLTLDYLEDRIVLSTYTPTVFTDGVTGNPNGTLRDAVLAANADTGTATDTIQLAAGTYTLSIANASGHDSTGTQGDLNITNTNHTLLIQGATNPDGTPATIIDQTALDRVFQIANPGTTVIFKNLVIEGGQAQDNGTAGAAAGSTTAEGGALYDNGGKLTMNNVVLVANHATGGNGQNAQGAALYAAGGTVNLTNCSIHANTAFAGNGVNGGNGGNAQGGGIYASGATLTISGGAVQANAVKGGSGAAGVAGGAGGAGGTAQGGGLYTTQTTLLIENGAAINGNSVFGGFGGIGGAGGAGVQGGAGGAGGLAQGGGVFANGGSVTVTGLSTTIEGNTVTAGGAGQGGTGGAASTAGGAGGVGGVGGEADGGGIYAFAPVTINGGNSIIGNTVAGGRGGNGGTGGSGSTGGNGGAGGVGGQAQGGGLFVASGNFNVALGDSSSSATINGGTATAGMGGSGGNGGRSTIAGKGGAGGTGGAGGNGTGGDVTVLGNTLTLTNATLVSGTVNAGGGGFGGIGTNGGAGGVGGAAGTGQGGGLFVAANSNATVLNSTLYNNAVFGAVGGLGGTGAGNASGGTGSTVQGGGLYAASSTLNILNSTIADNVMAAGSGGSNSALTARAVGGTAQGGGLYAGSGTITLINDTIAWNFLNTYTDRGEQPGQGGGVYNAAATMSANNTIIALDEIFSSSTTPPSSVNPQPYSDLTGAVSGGNNLIGDGIDATLAPGGSNQLFAVTPTTSPSGVSAQVAGNYDGLTYTLPLYASNTSLAVGQGNASTATGSPLALLAAAEGVSTANATDQRGLARVTNGQIDIGATQTQNRLLLFGSASVSVAQASSASATTVQVGSTSVSTVQAGDTITYTFTLSNNEPNDATNVNLTDTLPTGTTFNSQLSSPGWTVGPNGTVTMTVGTLPANATVTFTLVVDISSGATGDLANNTSVTYTPAGSSQPVSANLKLNTNVGGPTTTDITNEVKIIATPPVRDPFAGAGYYVQRVMFINESGAPITGPVALVLNNLPAGVTVANPSGMVTNADGTTSPYINIEPPGGTWRPGARYFLVAEIQFFDPTHVKITYTPEILQGI